MPKHPMGSASAALSRELTSLYQKADAPTYKQIVHHCATNNVKVTDSSIADWISGKAVPRSSKAFGLVVRYLLGRAKSKNPSYTPQPPHIWEMWRRQAQQERRSNQGRGGVVHSDLVPPKKLLAELTDPMALDAHPAINGPANMGTARVTARSAYLQQVRRIVPPDPSGLIGRAAELVELARFCLEPERGPYMWWQARAWAGKSALMSTFVLRPPAEVADRVRIVSFFITARLAAQDTRDTFVQVLLEQLVDLTGQDLPAVLPEATREAYLLDLLDQAAGICKVAGGRLVLVVDGLDEDRSVTTGPNAHSIAGLLPADPPAGMRVIVAGRANPPLPDDVPDWHPLRDTAIVRSLHDSPHARDIRRLSRRELHRLLHGTLAEQNLLGLLTAARGGLSGPDLEELTGVPLWDVEEILHTVAGRTFTRWASRWAPGTSPEIYVLGHEELQTAASDYFGHRLTAYYGQLYEWADGYRTRGWPAGTPEYLLSGYYHLLTGLGDLPRMIACAGDAARHNRMLDSSGGDSSALAEIRAAREMLLSNDEPDLVSIARLALHNMWLEGRNGSVPAALPAVVAKLGKWERAEALARAITYDDVQAEALACLSKVAAAAGDVHKAHSLASRAEAITMTITDPHGRSVATLAAAEAAAAAGDVEHAEKVAKSQSNSYWRAITIAAVVRAAVTAGYQADATSVANSIFDPFEDVISEPTAAIEESMSFLARPRSVRRGYDSYLRRFGTPGHHERTFADLARATAMVGDVTRTHQLVETLESVSKDQPDSIALAIAADALACIGDHRRSVDLATRAQAAFDAARSPDTVVLLARLARAAATVSDYERAAQLANQAAVVAQQKPTSAERKGGYIEKMRLSYRATQLTIAAEVVADWSETQLARVLAQEAETCARLANVDRYDASDLAQLASALGGVDLARAAEMLELAETVAHMQDDPESTPHDLHAVAQAAATLGDLERVETIVAEFKHPLGEARALCEAAVAAAAANRQAKAKTLITRAEVHIQRSNEPNDAHPLFLLTKAVSKVGDLERARSLLAHCASTVELVPQPDSQAFDFADLSELAAELGDQEQGRRLAQASHRCATVIVDKHRRAELLAVAARAAATLGDTDDAYAIAEEIEKDSYHRERALEYAALAAARCGDLGRAGEIALKISNLSKRTIALAHVAETAAVNDRDHIRAKDMAAEAQMMAQEIVAAEHDEAGAALDKWHSDMMDRMPSSRGYLLAAVAGALSAVGNSTAAESLLSEIADPFQMGRGLVALSKHVVPTQARRLLARGSCSAG